MTDQLDPQAVRVVLVDDRPERRQLVRRVVENCGVAASVVAEVGSEGEVIALVEVDHPDLVLLEIQIPVEAGLDAISALRRRYPLLRILVCSFHRRKATKLRALELGADEYLEKPISPSDVTAALRRLFPDAPTPGELLAFQGLEAPSIPDQLPPPLHYAGASAQPHGA